MEKGSFGAPRFTTLAELEYSVTISPSTRLTDEDINRLENGVVGIVDDNIIPDVSTKDVSSGRVQEQGVPLDQQDVTITVETGNVSTSNVTLNNIESDISDVADGEVTAVSVKAVPTNPVKNLIDRIL